jgi:hypothetical protein
MTNNYKVKSEEEKKCIFEQSMSHQGHINEEELKSYNLFYEHNADVHPTGENVYVSSVYLSGLGLYEQSKYGIYNDFTGEIAAKFNIACFIHNQKYFVQVTNIADTPSNSVTAQFCSKIPETDYTLPQSLFRACSFVSAQYPDHSTKLEEAILSGFAEDILLIYYDCLIRCCEFAFELYQFSSVRDNSFDYSYETRSYLKNLAIEYNDDFGRSSPTTTGHKTYEDNGSFYQDFHGITFQKNGNGIHIPVTINAFLKDDRICIQISTLSENELDTCVMQFSSKIGIVEQSAIQHASTFIRSRYLEFSEILLKALSVVTYDVLHPEENVITTEPVECPNHCDEDLESIEVFDM